MVGQSMPLIKVSRTILSRLRRNDPAPKSRIYIRHQLLNCVKRITITLLFTLRCLIVARSDLYIYIYIHDSLLETFWCKTLFFCDHPKTSGAMEMTQTGG